MPARFNPFQRDFHHHDTDNVVTLGDRPGKVVTPLTRCDAEGKVASGAPAHGLGKIGPETVVLADEAARQVPVAGGQGRALRIQQVDVGRVDDVGGALQKAVDVGLHGPVGGVGQQLPQPRIQRQHPRNGRITRQNAFQFQHGAPQLIGRAQLKAPVGAA